MSKFGPIDIPIVTQGAGDTANLLPVMHQVRHGMQQLIESGEETIIDLMAMPFGPGELERLLERLGTGEVTASVDALGETRVHESRFPGVWVVDHRNTEGVRIALQIEITRMPQILRTQLDDLADSLEQLGAELEE
jgi:hydrogenase-1 operon protein HyaF